MQNEWDVCKYNDHYLLSYLFSLQKTLVIYDQRLNVTVRCGGSVQIFYLWQYSVEIGYTLYRVLLYSVSSKIHAFTFLTSEKIPK